MIILCKHQRLISFMVQGSLVEQNIPRIGRSWLLVDRGLCSNACSSSSSGAITLRFALEQ